MFILRLSAAAKVRLNSLRDAVKAAGAGGADLAALSVQPNVAVSIDLLTVLMSDEDAAVRTAAVEVSDSPRETNG